ncbi:hypothetical protein [Subtercola endophyticus]|uniref:hypothetical protein n=1 Tax=Subtercola endophyticus TaxID=2895559 RepID=UPI001E60FD54|nr:hypothetical protein [Subtercola endophyticus]UFS60736.1 hypothetical protein LQ955_08375 [Subtercola endophyticus]
MAKKFALPIAVALSIAATGALGLASASSASAGSMYAPPVTTSSDLSFVVPLTNDPAQARVDVGGQLEDPFLTDNLAGFSISITCPGMAPVNVVTSPSVISADSRYGSILFAGISAWLPKSEEGSTCTIHAASSSANRKLVFAAPSTKPGETGDTSRLYFSGTVILKSSTGGLG